MVIKYPARGKEDKGKESPYQKGISGSFKEYVFKFFHKDCRFLKNIKIPLYGNGQNIRDWIYVDDHIDALVQILEHGEADMTYNIGGDNEIKNIDVLINICKILDEQKPRKDNQSYQDLIEYVPDRLGHDQRYAIDNTHITQQLGWKPKTTFKEGIEKTVEWYVKTQS